MALLEEDGSLDVEWINKLPIYEWMNLMGQLSEEQFDEYMNKTSLNEGVEEPSWMNEANFTTKEELERNGFVDADEAMNKIMEKYGFK